MAKLKLGAIEDDKPVKITVELSAHVHRDLLAYADILARETGGETPLEPARLVAPMLARFMATDRAFAQARRATDMRTPGVPAVSSVKTSQGELPDGRD